VVKLDKIVTKAGDSGTTRLATGEDVPKGSLRVEAYGGVDETNSAIGVARLHAPPSLDVILARIQNDLFDLGADLATPVRDKPLPFEALRISDAQVDRLEAEAEQLNAQAPPLTSFVLPGGTPAAAHLHLARAIARRAERAVARLMLAPDEIVSPAALKYLNRLSDVLFCAARAANAGADVFWTPGANR
jgi:cob(I)alamin adenosyltransferase